MAALEPVYWEAATPAMRELLRHIGRQVFARDFYLAGGTAVALRIGHRRSIDLDLFSETDELLAGTRRQITEALAPFAAESVEDVDGNLLLSLPEFHVAFLSYGYPLVGPTDDVENVAVASLLDLGLMKLDAMISRGSRKDFYDLYFIARQWTITDLLEGAKAKYPYARDFELMAVESMVLFDNAERDVQPELLVDVEWLEVKEYFISVARDLGREWFGPL